MIKPLTAFMTRRELQAFLAPYSFDLFVIDIPALNAKELGDLAITVTPVLFSEPDQRQTQGVIISPWLWIILLR